MSLLCLLWPHKPSPPSIKRSENGDHAALYEACAMPLEGKVCGRLKPAEPLV